MLRLSCRSALSLQVLLHYSEMLQKKFLLFTTGSDRVPVGGMQEMTFKISKLKVRFITTTTNTNTTTNTTTTMMMMTMFSGKDEFSSRGSHLL